MIRLDYAALPVVMTPEEACAYLRLTDGERSEENALQALDRIVTKGLIRPAKIGKLRRYWRAELDRYVQRETERYGELRA